MIVCVTDHCSLPCNLEEQPCETMTIKPLVEPLFTYIFIRMALKPVSSSLPFCLLNMNRRQEQCSAVHSETVMTPVLPGQITSPDTSAVGPASPVNLISYLHIFDLKEKNLRPEHKQICHLPDCRDKPVLLCCGAKTFTARATVQATNHVFCQDRAA